MQPTHGTAISVGPQDPCPEHRLGVQIQGPATSMKYLGLKELCSLASLAFLEG
jgi:hypothetical protein